ncbi:MAG: NFACT family protein [Candidatus Krumholzibacteriota bacterium]|nr:NFACT family protein [Candidatus Krumholzibacteriota bacterium]
MNSLSAYALATELDASLTGSTITGISRFEGGLSLSLGNDSIPFLHILFPGRQADIALSSRALAPPSFSTPVLEQIAGAVISGASPLDLDRIILLKLDSTTSWGEIEKYILRLDLSPAHRSVALFQAANEKLLGSFGPARSRNPSSPGHHPPRKAYSLLELPPEIPLPLSAQLEKSYFPGRDPGGLLPRSAEDGKTLLPADILLRSIQGLDPVLSRGLLREAGSDGDKLWSLLRLIGERLRGGKYSWFLYDIPEAGISGRQVIYPLELPPGLGTGKPLTFHRALESWGAGRVIPAYLEGLKRAAVSRANKDLSRCRRLLDNLTGDLEEAEKAREFRQLGNLLVTYRHLLARGMKEIEVSDYSGGRKVAIPLNPKLTPDRNIQLYFRKAKKGEKGLLVIKNRRLKIEKELQDKKELLEKISGLTAVEEILGIFPRREEGGGRRKDNGQIPVFRSYRLDDRHTAYVGRSDRENDQLTHRFAAAGDLWFHAQGSAGSHVILRGANRSTPKKIIEMTASLAAWFSKARKASTVPVIYTEKRYVRKPRGSRPGTAACMREKTIFVTPSLPVDRDPK